MTATSLILTVLGTTAAGVLLIFLTLLIVRRRRRPPYRAEVRVQTGVEVETGRLAHPGGPFDKRMTAYPEGNPAGEGPSGPLWQVAFTDQTTGRAYQRRFQGCLYLGREQPEPRDHVLYVGTDTSISRLQCMLKDTGGGIVISHCGQVNPTRLNGTVLSGEQALYVGDMVSFAGVQLKVSLLRQIS